MTEDENAKAAEFGKPWRNWHRSRRASELRRELASIDEPIEITDWYLEDQKTEPER